MTRCRLCARRSIGLTGGKPEQTGVCAAASQHGIVAPAPRERAGERSCPRRRSIAVFSILRMSLSKSRFPLFLGHALDHPIARYHRANEDNAMAGQRALAGPAARGLERHLRDAAALDADCRQGAASRETPLINHWWNVTFFVNSRGLVAPARPLFRRHVRYHFRFDRPSPSPS